MEPASLNTEAAGHGARMGSLENPEVIENVPGHVIPILEQEFDDFDTESDAIPARRLEDDEFIKFRLRQGVYGQRQPDVQMIRVKLPMGGVTPISSTRSPPESSATCHCARATSRPGRTSRCTTSRCPTPRS